MPDMKACNGPFGTGGCTSLCILANTRKAESQLIFVFKIQAAIDFSDRSFASNEMQRCS